MGAFFSSVDDKYELDDPGIHLTVGRIDTVNMKYEIAASVVGNKRRFIVNYDQLIDATPIEGITFHEKVLEYVDTTPTVYKPYVKPAASKIGNFIKKLPPVKNTPKKTYNSIDEYYADKYGSLLDEDYAWENDQFTYDTDKCKDPFYWNDGQVQVTEIPNDDLIASSELYQIVDLLEDHFKEIRNDSDALEEMKQQLAAFLIAVELELSQ
jgi:hypothetical protein